MTSLLGLAIYQSCMRDWPFRSLLWSGELLNAALSLPDILFFARLNENLGIPDTVFVLGPAATRNVIYQWRSIPIVVLFSQLCPEGMEVTMFALLAGCSNLGNSISDYVGAYL